MFRYQTAFSKFIIASTLFLTVIFGYLPTEASTRSLYALVIGNSAYHQNPLRNPVNDATDMAEVLEKFGFFVELHTNADQRTMDEAVVNFSRKLNSNNSVGLFYFAGHGVEYRGRNYLIPIKAGIGNELDLKYKALDAGYVLDGMSEAGNGLNMVILDACRNNPYRSMFRSASRGLKRMNPARGTLMLYATQPGAVASDGSGRNGIFTKHLLSAMQADGLEIEQVFKRTALAVDRETGGRQTPWVEGVVLGHFAFNEGGETMKLSPVPAIQPLTPPPPEKPQTGYLQVNVNTPARVELDGRYVGNARPYEPLNLSNISLGTRHLIVTADSGASQELRSSIRANQWTQEVVAFEQRVEKTPPLIAPPPPIAFEPKEENGYLFAYGHISGPSFRCSDASQPVEILICRDSSLRQADGIMGKMYQDLRRALSKSAADQIRSTQRQWLKDRDQNCPVSRYDLGSSSRTETVVSCLLNQVQTRNKVLWDALSRTGGQ
jgi:uncharacterized protein YecT (DUF1311 family)